MNETTQVIIALFALYGWFRLTFDLGKLLGWALFKTRLGRRLFGVDNEK